MLEPRQEQLLNLVIEKYIETAEPIGSRFLVEEAKLDWSEATVRNDLRDLEAMGFLTHPHTSAGRVPTTSGYHFYVEKTNFNDVKLSKREAAELESEAQNASDFEQLAKQLAKSVVELSAEMVLLAFSPQKVYYTGLSNLFQKPDFGERELMVDVSSMFDRCEELLPKFFDIVGKEPKYFLGDEHPFGTALSVLSVRCGENNTALLALLGPQRMDYKHNWALVQKTIEVL
jgi:heat-inducible transcriptional repressor